MTAVVSLLRGINVGGRAKLSMATLKRVYEGLGFDGVTTLLNSGNVVFRADAAVGGPLASRIEKAIEAEAGFRPAVILRTAAELRGIIEGNSFPAMAESDPSHLLVMALVAPPAADAAERIAEAYQGPEEIRIAGADVYLTYPDGIGRSKLTNALLEKHLGAGTARNWNTLTRLSAIAERL